MMRITLSHIAECPIAVRGFVLVQNVSAGCINPLNTQAILVARNRLSQETAIYIFSCSSGPYGKRSHQ